MPRLAGRRLEEGPLQSGENAADNRGMRDGEGSAGFSEDRAADLDLSFAAFVFAHLHCGDATVELRLGEGVLLEWCPACAVLQTFGPSEA